MSATRLPSPRAHRAASLRLFDALAEASGGMEAFPGAEVLRRVLGRPRAVPAAVPAAANGLKYDGYLTRSRGTDAWGFTCSDRYEGRTLWRVVEELAADLPGDRAALPAARRFAEGLDASLQISVGFDAPGEPPRLKLYLQERRWGDGVATIDGLRERARALLGAELPAGLGELAVGVVTVDVVGGPNGGARLKLYAGGADRWALVRRIGAGVPGVADELATLAGGLDRAEVREAGFHYVTLRVTEDPERPRVALNPIYDVHRLGFRDGDLRGAWDEVDRLFAVAGVDGGPLRDVRATLDDLLLVPTATALEAGGTSADAYLSAWPRD